MKICYDYQIFNTQKYGGVSRYHIELANRIGCFENCEVEIPCLWNDNEYLGSDYNGKTSFFYKHIRHRFSGSKNRFFSKINFYLNDYDIIHPTWVDSYIWSIKSKAKIVITIHDMIHELFWKDRFPDEIERKRLAIYKSDFIIAISNNTKNDILKFYPDIPDNKIRVIYHGTSKLPDPVCPESFDVPNKYILYVGSRHDYKQGMFVLDSFSYILSEFPDVMLVFAGGGGFSQEEKSLILKKRLQNNIIQKNVSDAELAYLYNNAVCFVYPSLYEGFGLPILEAFDNGCPVICAKDSSLPEVGGSAVLYFDSYDSEGLYKQIKSLLISATLRKEIIDCGATRGQLFSWDKCAKETYEVYKSICQHE